MLSNLNKKILTAGIWSVAMRWSIRFLGIFSTLVLVRLLVPEDFGLVAMAMIVVGLTSVLLEFGVNMAIIQSDHASPALYNSAWTLRIFQSMVVTILIILVIPFAITYFHEPRIAMVLNVIAVSVLINGFENIGVVAFQKELDFEKDFKFMVVKKVLTVAVTLVLAFYLHNYWSLVFGILLGSLLSVVFSYFISSYRPKIEFSEIKALWAFSQWVLVRNIGAYLQTRLDQIIIGNRLGTEVMGVYTVSDEIAALPTSEILTPINRVLFPAFSLVKNNKLKLKKLFLDAYQFQCLLAIPMGCGLFMLADAVVTIVMGEKWLMAIPLIKVLALVGIALALRHSPSSLLTAIGKVKLIAIGVWVQLFCFFSLAVFAFPMAGMVGIALIRLLMSSLQTGVFIWILVNQGLSSFRQLLQALWRPILASLIMMGGLFLYQSIFTKIAFIHILIQIIFGALIYIVAVFLLWFLAKKPQGLEQTLILKYLNRKNNDKS